MPPNFNWLLPFDIGYLTVWYPPLLIALLCFAIAGYLFWKWFILPKRSRDNIPNIRPSIFYRFCNRWRNRVPHAKPNQKKITTNQYDSDNDNQL